MGNSWFEKNAERPRRDFTGTYEFKRYFPDYCMDHITCHKTQIGFFKSKSYNNPKLSVYKFYHQKEGKGC